MSINAGNMIPDAVTYVDPTGGTSDVFEASLVSPGKMKAFLSAQNDFLSRSVYEFTAKDPVVAVNAPGGWTQSRAQLLIKVPMTLANGLRTVNTGLVSMSYDPEFSQTDLKSLRLSLAQGIGAGAFNNFWNMNVLA